MRFHRPIAFLIAALLGGITGCTNPEPAPETLSAPSPLGGSHGARAGEKLFKQAFPGTNGRSCATCHVLGEHTTLRPASVVARLAANPDDPLFDRLDADDPAAPVPTFEHLKKGLVRVVLTLPDNMDVIDEHGQVITSPDRTIFVWRGVPAVADTAITGPYQYDGRLVTLPEQAQAAFIAHAGGGGLTASQLDQIAAFERDLFSSPRARFVSKLLELGVPSGQIPIPEDYMALNAAEERGREVHRAACQPCHGGPTTTQIVDRAAHDRFFFELKPDGNLRFTIDPVLGPVPVFASRPDDEFLQLGFGFATYLGQIGQFPAFNATVELPRYRFRFYSDGTRQQAVTELPPIPVTASGDPFDPNPALDQDGAPIVGPSFNPQWFTTDPGRAIVTGDPADFEAFDVPSLRGVAHTAPYFHDNSHETLAQLVDSYSAFILPFLPSLNLPPVHPPSTPGIQGESLSAAEKHDLLAFLGRL